MDIILTCYYHTINYQTRDTHLYSVKDKPTLFVLLKYNVTAIIETKVSINVCSSMNKSNDVTTIPTVQASITVYIKGFKINEILKLQSV